MNSKENVARRPIKAITANNATATTTKRMFTAVGTVLLLVAVSATVLIGAISSASSAQKPTLPNSAQGVTTVTASEAQVSKKEVESPNEGDQVKLINSANSIADFDFIAINQQGEEMEWQTIEVPPNGKSQVKLQDVFPGLAFGNLSTIEVESSVRPADSTDGGKIKAALVSNQLLLSVAFFSQRDPRWANNRLGTCSTTIGQQGCAITSIAMAGARSVYNFNPATLNAYLTNNGGYASGCLVVWSAPAKIDGSGGFTYIGTGTVSSAANLKSVINLNRFAVARSYRFSSHYVIIIGYYNQGSYLSDYVYLDPWDTSATYRRVNDGWVTATSSTQIYQ